MFGGVVMSSIYQSKGNECYCELFDQCDAEQQSNSRVWTRKSPLAACGNDQQSIVYHEAARTDFLTGLGQMILPQR